MSNSPTEHDEGAHGSPDTVFALLGNETRIGILQVLWDAFESGTGDNALSFSEVFEQVDYDESGNFSYHLEKLTGPFIRKTDDGYELKQTGINVVRAIVEGTVTEDPAFGPTSVDIACPICDGPVEIAYADELMTVYCTACEGRIQWKDEPGHLFGALVPPAGIEQRPIEEAFRAAVVYTLYKIAAFSDGVCSDCSGPVETTVDICPDHTPGEATRCPTCDRFHMAEGSMTCSTCKLRIFPPVTLVVLNEPDVTTFYHDHDIEHRFASWETVARSYHVGEAFVSEDPLRLGVTIPAEGDELRLTIDGDVNVVEVMR